MMGKMNRLWIMKSKGMLLAAALLSAGTVPAQQPNILFLVVDDLNTWLLENPDRYTGEVIAPNIKALAESGVRFTQAFTASPKCSPSRTAFLSGVVPWKSGVYENAQDPDNSPALQGIPNLIQHFHDHGYYTSGGGKISHGYSLGEVWDDWITDHEIRDKPYPLLPDGSPLKGWGTPGVEKDWGAIDNTNNIGYILEEDMMDTWSAEFAIRQINTYTNQSQPFLFVCGLFHPHFPWHAPQRFFDMYPLEDIVLPEINENDQDDIPPLGISYINAGLDNDIKSHNHVKNAIQGYLASTTYADAQIGRVLAALESSPYATNTIVVLLTDHGFHLGEKQHWAKSTLWEEAMNSILMFRVPGVTETNRTCARTVSLMDVYPTLVELAGLPDPGHLDGRSLVPLLQNPASDWDHPAISSFNMELTVRSQDYRYIRYTDGSEELYDRTVDPREWVNLAGDPAYAAVKEDLNTLLPAPHEMAPPMYKDTPMMLTVDIDMAPDGPGDTLMLSPISIDGKSLVQIHPGATSLTFSAAYEKSRMVTIEPASYNAEWQGGYPVEANKAYVDMGTSDKTIAGQLTHGVLPPITLPSCLAHYDASVSSSVVTDHQDVVTMWMDRSGNGHHAVPAVGDVYFPSASLSESRLAGINVTNEGRSLQLFSAGESESWLDFTGAASTNSGFAALVAFKVDGLNSTAHDIFGNSTAVRTGFTFRMQSDGSNFKTWLGSALFTSSGSIVAGETIVLAANYDAGTGLYQFWNSIDNASNNDTVAATNFALSNPVTVGCTASPGRFLNGMVGEVIIFDCALRASEFEVARAGMVDKWITDASGYYGWASAHGLACGRYEDDDGDGDSNISEFYFGGNPTNALDTCYLPVIEPQAGTDDLRLIYRRRVGLPDSITYRIEQTDKLNPPEWLDIQSYVVGQDVAPEDGNYLIITNLIPAAMPMSFMRLVVEDSGNGL
jgi:arylsulfatase A-like enzyme